MPKTSIFPKILLHFSRRFEKFRYRIDCIFNSHKSQLNVCIYVKKMSHCGRQWPGREQRGSVLASNNIVRSLRQRWHTNSNAFASSSFSLFYYYYYDCYTFQEIYNSRLLMPSRGYARGDQWTELQRLAYAMPGQLWQRLIIKYAQSSNERLFPFFFYSKFHCIFESILPLLILDLTFYQRTSQSYAISRYRYGVFQKLDKHSSMKSYPLKIRRETIFAVLTLKFEKWWRNSWILGFLLIKIGD